MSKIIKINHLSLEAEDVHQEIEKDKRKVRFNFKVTSKDYHEITTTLYKNNFTVEIPDENITFQATIQNYSTSVTDLYKENQVGTFTLELKEV